MNGIRIRDTEPCSLAGLIGVETGLRSYLHQQHSLSNISSSTLVVENAVLLDMAANSTLGSLTQQGQALNDIDQQRLFYSTLFIIAISIIVAFNRSKTSSEEVPIVNPGNHFFWFNYKAKVCLEYSWKATERHRIQANI